MVNEDKEEPKQLSRLMVEFESVGSAIFKIQTEGVTPVQMLALSEWLKWEATSNLNMMKEEQLQLAAARKLSIPEPQILRGR